MNKLSAILLLLFILVVPGYAQTPAKPAPFIGFGGVYAAFARVAPIDGWHCRRQDFSAEITAIFPLRQSRWSLQAELIQPLAVRRPLVRLAVAVRLF